MKLCPAVDCVRSEVRPVTVKTSAVQSGRSALTGPEYLDGCVDTTGRSGSRKIYIQQTT